MVLQAQLEPQDREALWVFLVRGENVECQVFQDQGSVPVTLLSLKNIVLEPSHDFIVFVFL